VAAGLSGGLCAAGGFVGGFIGSWLGHRWDDPPTRTRSAQDDAASDSPPPDVRPALLFGLTFSLFLAALLGFASLEFMATHPAAQEWCVVVIAVIAGFLPPCFKGMLNNLRNE
jgi:hypothetical protein